MSGPRSYPMNNSGREAILNSIRTHLAASVPYDSRELPVHPESPVIMSEAPLASSGLIGLFKRSLEAVDGHCIIVRGEAGIARALTQIIGALQKTNLRGQRIEISDLPQVEQWMQLTDLDIEELGIAPNASAIFGYDVGITTAQAAIAETGTLVLDSTRERNRLVSLVPPVHIAVVAASTIYATLSETLALLQKTGEVSPAVTFVTGPSRTADIELTLAIGVHGPQELYVIIES
jgi:L-lactate dehydrogenase complex protein LldG